MAIINQLPHMQDSFLLDKVNVAGNATSGSHYYSAVLDTGNEHRPCTYYLTVFTRGNTAGTIAFEGSDNQTVWDELKTKTSSTGTNQLANITDKNVTTYRYYRAHGYSSNSVQVSVNGMMVCPSVQ